MKQPELLAWMLARRAARLAAEPTKYHAVTGWDVALDGESADPYCRDCGTSACWPWERIQNRLDRQRWRMSGMPHGTAGMWGGDTPF